MTEHPTGRKAREETPVQRLRSNSGEHTKTRLLDVARETAALMPYPEITVEHLTEPAKVSRATFYLYFRNKTDIYLALTADACEQVFEAAGDWGRPDSAPAEQIEQAIHGYLTAFVAHLGPMRLLYTVAPTDDRFDAILRDLTGRFLACVHQRLRDGQAAGQFRPELDPAQTAEALWGLVEGFCHRQLLPGPGISFGGPKLRRSAQLLADLGYHAIAAEHA
jgi:AcrR family transcriptional regulator